MQNILIFVVANFFVLRISLLFSNLKNLFDKKSWYLK